MIDCSTGSLLEVLLEADRGDWLQLPAPWDVPVTDPSTAKVCPVMSGSFQVRGAAEPGRGSLGARLAVPHTNDNRDGVGRLPALRR